MINISQMIKMIGKTPSEIIAAGLLAENKKPKPRFSGDDELVLNMIREGVYLAFDRSTKKLIRIALTLLDSDKPKYSFPNELPSPFKAHMTRNYIEQTIGQPFEYKPPMVFMGDVIGCVAHYRLDQEFFGELSLLVSLLREHDGINTNRFCHALIILVLILFFSSHFYIH